MSKDSDAVFNSATNGELGGLSAQARVAVRGLGRIPFAAVRDELPAGTRELYARVQDNQALIPGLKMGVGALVVQKWDQTYAAAGWTLYGADLILDAGHPFGSMFYLNDADGRVLRVGVEWHTPVQQLEFPALHPSKPELTSDCSDEEVAVVVLDARSRIGVLVAANAQIGSFVATEESEDAILDASGLGLERLSEDDPRLAGRDSSRPPRPGGGGADG
ncbi:hypothetical protein KK092_09720 [Curtobacterium flaccumfaciens pv. flaccumfaciens]|uniref:hypothetical protein n=1 Tax=Curtobacterium flaccumfaciens TaxID=2035 RepID=UPI001BDDF256|nr:hypothetical protein [Curtobacterium flaccumfaciens]MBT1669659.1 hypothetical protein [Curtobacterium flaccumfaciens pv. flaccumfaciens]